MACLKKSNVIVIIISKQKLRDLQKLCELLNNLN